MMDKTFDPGVVEGRISAQWEKAGAFRAGRPERAAAEPFCIVIPPPNVTGNLHMGHALNNTLQDILCRYWRMRGRDVLWQPGTDHAGIATQMVVERQLMERQEPSRREMGREKFLERVWAWKAESGGAIVGQLKRLGASCDWSRERFTMDEGLSKAVIKVFVELYRQRLIYKDKRLVNWDPKLQTAISDLEVVQVETKGSLWHLRYPIVDATGGETGEHIVVATTRPETMLGDTAVAVHPDDERYKHLHGKKARLPLVGRLIPIIADAYSDPEKGSGAVKITPAHDFNDFEVGKRHEAEGVKPINVLSADASIKLKDNDAFLEGAAEEGRRTAADLDGLDRLEARKRVVALLEARGLIEKIEPHVYMVPHGDRSAAVIEPWLTDQWYVDAKTLAQPALKAVRDGETIFTPKTWEKTYFDWLENIQPWCVSRQLWWGHQIPAWYGLDGAVFVAETAEEAIGDALADAVEKRLLSDGEAKTLIGDPERLAALVTRDPDVLDTWFSSALWPFSTLGWPEETPELKRFYPNNALVTGFDIIFFWVARMMMMGLHFRR
ncbi:MAG TPA: valine--tRNA ligase, partial [Roseiarcus sp.]|nr:valine--tRNA ligase [Roseiarcus sp.]